MLGPMETLDLGTDYERLNAILWRSRSHLDRMEFLLEVQLLLLSEGRLEWQHQMAELSEEVAEALAVNDLEREMSLTSNGSAGQPSTLRDIATQAPEPWSVIFADHLVQLEATTARISTLRTRADAAIRAGRDSVADLVTGLSAPRPTTPEGPTYGKALSGARANRSASAHFFDGRA